MLIFCISICQNIYRSCVVCYALGEGKRNKKLFIKGQVMHQHWMNRIADHCCTVLLFSLCCIRQNMAVLAYLQSIDEQKSFPTTIAFTFDNILRVIYIAFAALYLYIYQDLDIKVIVILIAFVITFAISMIRCRSKRTAQFQQRRASITKNSFASSL